MMHRNILLTALLLALLTSCTSLGREYGQRSTKVTVTTQSQMELDEVDGERAPDDPIAAERKEAARRLAATVYTMTWRQWQQMNGAALLEQLRAADLREDAEAQRTAALQLAAALLRYQRGEGKTPLVLSMPMSLHVVVAERDGRYQAVEFNPQRQNTAILGL